MNSVNAVDAVKNWIKLGRPYVDGLDQSLLAPKTCPSYPDSRSGVPLLVRMRDGTFDFGDGWLVESHLVVSRRFAGPCVSTRCAYWSGNCQLGAMLSVSVKHLDYLEEQTVARLDCPVRGSCRWVAENGPQVCSVCVHVDYESEVDGRDGEVLLRS